MLCYVPHGVQPSDESGETIEQVDDSSYEMSSNGLDLRGRRYPLSLNRRFLYVQT